MRKRILPILAAILAFPAISLGQELSETKIINDYKAFLESPRGDDCRAAVKLTDIQLQNKELDESTATVTIVVTGDWITERALTFYADPCAGFFKAGGKDQKVEKTLFYRLDDSGWRLEGFQ